MKIGYGSCRYHVSTPRKRRRVKTDTPTKMKGSGSDDGGTVARFGQNIIHNRVEYNKQVSPIGGGRWDNNPTTADTC